MYIDLKTKDEINIWLSTYHEALRSPHLSNERNSSSVRWFAKECADEVIKLIRERTYNQELGQYGL
jgi:hypothetical protein